MPGSDGFSMTVRGAVARTGGARLGVETLTLHGLGEQDVLIENRAAGLCASDWGQLKGGKPGVLFPLLAGHEGAGVVLEVGRGVNGLAPGDHVATCALGECGGCPVCRGELSNLCEVAGFQGLTSATRWSPHFDLDGQPVALGSPGATFATHTICDQAHVTCLPRELPFEVACLLGCAVMTGVGSVINTARVRPGSTVVVFGLGGVGLNVVDGARLAGASRIVGIDVAESKAAIAREFGLTDFVGAKGNDRVVEQVRDLLRGGADYAFECTGAKGLVQQAVDVTRPEWGVTVLVGIPSEPELVLNARHVLSGRTLTGSYFGKTKARTGIAQLARWMVEGKLHGERLVSHRFPLERINDGFDVLRSGEGIRSVVVF